MAASSGGEQCEKQALTEWEKGYHFGFDDNYIESWCYRHYSKEYILGYLAGKAEIDRLVDDAAQRRYFE